jgi:hypothetical protein
VEAATCKTGTIDMPGADDVDGDSVGDVIEDVGNDIDVDEVAVKEDEEEDVVVNEDGNFDGMIVLNIVSTTASTKVTVPMLDVSNVVNVEIGKTHSTVPVCNSTTPNPSASANPPRISALKQLWTRFPAHSLD